MAQKTFSGNIGTPSSGFALYLVVNYTQSTAGNYTRIDSFVGYVKRNKSSYAPYNSSSAVTVKIAGVTYTASGAYDLRSDGWKTIISKSPAQIISHNSEGELSIACSISMNGKLSSYYPNGTVSSTLGFPNIPRVSDLAVNKITAPADGVTTVVATGTKKSSSFTDVITVTMGDNTMTVDSGVEFTIPPSWINAISGTSATAVVKLVTSSGTTVIGSKTANLTITVPEQVVVDGAIINVGPTINSINVTEAVTSITANFGNRFVKGLSRFNVSVVAVGAYGSTINSYSTALDGVLYISSAFTSNVINDSGVVNISTTVTDSRGRTATMVLPITVIDYAKPQINTMTADICNADGTLNSTGTCTKLTITGAISGVEEQNSKSLILTYKKTSEANYIDVPSIELSGYIFTAEAIIENTDPTVTYEYVAVLSDKINSVDRTVVTGVPVISRYAGGGGVAFFREASEEGLWSKNLQIDMTDAELATIDALLGGTSTSVTDLDIELSGGAIALVNSIYPVGHILSTTDETYNPNIIFNWTTWNLLSISSEGAIEKVLLWENASPSSDFGAQTIPFDVTEYDYLFVNATQYGTRTGILKCVVGSALQLFMAEPQSGYAPMMRSRSFSIVDEGLSVKQGAIQRTNSTSMTAADSPMIPHSIYGIKSLFTNPTYFWKRIS